VWTGLLKFAFPGRPQYQTTDQAFIDEWNAAINMFERIFVGVTLVVTPGSGLPNFGPVQMPPALLNYCPVRNDMDCLSEATILAHFADPTPGGPNAKAVQTSGLTARSKETSTDLSPKRVALSTARFGSPSAQILGAFQFATGVSRVPLQEGCTEKFPPGPADRPAACPASFCNTTDACVPVECIPQACLAPGVTTAKLAPFVTFGNVRAEDLISVEQGLYNVLRVFFNDTPAAASFGGTVGEAALNYLQIYALDIQYASSNANSRKSIVEPGGSIIVKSAQELLNLASQKLLEIGEPVVPR
jgi:hypothetical protein